MARKSTFDRVPNDWYATPRHAVLPLIPYLPQSPFTFMNPCAGRGHGIARLAEEAPQGICTAAFWIPGNGTQPEPAAPAPGKIVLGNSWDDEDSNFVENWPSRSVASMIISNPVYRNDWLFPLLTRAVADGRPSWWLIPSDKLFTHLWAEINPHARKTVPVGRVKWFPGSKYGGTQNFVWVLLDPETPGEHVLLDRPRTRRVDIDEPFEDPLDPAKLLPDGSRLAA